MSEEYLDDNTEQKNQIEYAGAWIRTKASLFDGLVTAPIGGIVIYNLLIVKSFPLLIFTTLLLLLYKPLMEWRYKATLGKMVCKIKVVNEKKEFLTIDQAFGRSIPWIINHALSLMSYYYIFQTEAFNKMNSIFNMEALSVSTPVENANTVYFFIFLVILGSLIYDKRYQGFHDKIAKTLVIKKLNQ